MNYFFQLFLCCIFLFPALETDAQIYERRGQVIYLEGGGPAVAYSINYECRFFQKTGGLGGRIGYGGTSFWHAIPININYLLGKKNKNHFLELGAGLTFFNYTGEDIIRTESKESQVLTTFTVMYRLHPRYGKFFFKIGLIPMFGDIPGIDDPSVDKVVWFGMAVGRAF